MHRLELKRQRKGNPAKTAGPQVSVPNSLLLLVLVVVFILFFKITKYLLNYNYDIQLIFNTIMI